MGQVALAIDASLSVKYKRLLAIIRDCAPVAVAFSGGTDSSFLLHAAVAAVGAPVTALFADSSLLKPDEREMARKIALTMGCQMHLFEIDPLSWPEFTVNTSIRCYHCKKKIYTLFGVNLLKQSRQCLLDGTNTDDLKEERPGRLAVQELGVRAPLLEAGLSKKEIRVLSRKAGLSTWNTISSSCLATRIPTGSEITAEKLTLVRKCEDQLNRFGFFGCRARLFGSSVRIELCEADLARFIGDRAMPEIRDFIRSLGVEKVLLDLNSRKGIDIDAQFL